MFVILTLSVRVTSSFFVSPTARRLERILFCDCESFKIITGISRIGFVWIRSIYIVFDIDRRHFFWLPCTLYNMSLLSNTFVALFDYFFTINLSMRSNFSRQRRTEKTPKTKLKCMNLVRHIRLN